MTSKLGQQSPDAEKLAKFPHFPPRDDMQNSLHLDDPAHQAALVEHFGNHQTTLILSEIPVRTTPGGHPGVRIPDLLIAFGVDRAQAVDQNGYSIQDLGKPPDFVLEIASVTTAARDITDKRRDYANFGIPEYWRFDPTGGQRHDVPIAGDHLVEGEYQAIEILEVEPGHLHGHSSVLNLDPCWEQGQLRWYDPVARRHLMTFAEEREARFAAEERAIAAEARVRQLEEELTTGDRDC